jgi:hypothetical protein
VPHVCQPTAGDGLPSSSLLGPVEPGLRPHAGLTSSTRPPATLASHVSPLPVSGGRHSPCPGMPYSCSECMRVQSPGCDSTFLKCRSGVRVFFELFARSKASIEET